MLIFDFLFIVRSFVRFQGASKSTTQAPSAVSVDTATRRDIVPREIIKFELADAKIPDFPLLQPRQRQNATRATTKLTRRVRSKQFRSSDRDASTETKDVQQQMRSAKTTKATKSSDSSGSSSRIMQIVHPSPINYEPIRQHSIKELPFSVRKAISHAMKQDYNIPYLDTIKYYLKDPPVKYSSGKLSSIDSPSKPWWQTSNLKSFPPSATSFSLAPQHLSESVINTTPKTIASSSLSASSSSTTLPFPSNEFVAYPLLRAYSAVRYPSSSSSSSASSSSSSGSLIDAVTGSRSGLSFLYGDRIYTKIPYSHGAKVSTSVATVNDVTSDVRPVEEVKSSTFSSLTSTSPILFPSITPPTLLPTTPKPKPVESIVRYYSAVDTTRDNDGVELSDDRDTLNLISKAVDAIKKHNPHLDVIPKKIENDELIVHVTPKPEYFIAPTDRVRNQIGIDNNNLAYRLINEPDSKKSKASKVVNHHYMKQIHAPATSVNSVSLSLPLSCFCFAHSSSTE